MTILNANPKIELRIFKDPSADRVASNAMLTGTKMRLEKYGFRPDVKEFNWRYWLFGIENELFSRGHGKLNVADYTDILHKEKEDIYNGIINDKPHWDLVMTSKPMNSYINRNLAYGRFQGCVRDYQESPVIQGSIVLSTDMIRDSNPRIRGAKGVLLGYHETSHLTGGHCKNHCVHNGGYEASLTDLARTLLRTKKIPKCELDHSQLDSC